MARTFTFVVLSDGYKIYINGNPHAGIIQQGYMPYVDTTIPVGTVEYYTRCAELNIAELQKADLEVENYMTDMEQTQEDVLSAMTAITELYEMMLVQEIKYEGNN